MLSSKDPAARQEFKVSALPPEAAEDSDLISALTKLVNEVYASAEDGPLDRGLGDSTGEFGMLARRAQPSGHRYRTGTCLIRRAESMRLGMQHYAASRTPARPPQRGKK
jgi:hypothetical protein